MAELVSTTDPDIQLVEEGKSTSIYDTASSSAEGAKEHQLGQRRVSISIPHIESDTKIVQQSYIENLARVIFNDWDTLKNGCISLEEIKESGLDDEFVAAFSRILDYDESGIIHFQDLVNTLKVLKNGTMREKVQLVMKFMDRDGNGKIGYEDADFYLKSAPKEICKRLGLINEQGEHGELVYEDLLALFESSDRGVDALDIFCDHILTVLQSRSGGARPRRVTSIYHNFSNLSLGFSARLINSIPKSTMFIIALILLQMALWAYNFNYYWQQGLPPSFCIAKGFGLNLRIITILLFLTMARTTMGFLINLRIFSVFIPLGFNIQIHSFLGFCSVLHAFGHMFGHIAFHTEEVDGGFAHSFKQKSLFTNARWSEKGSGDAITGYILMIILFLMAGTALCRSRGAEGYLRFSLTHYLYNAWLVFIFLHVPHLWPFFIFIVGIMVIERSFDYLQQTNHSTLSTSRPCSNGVTFLSIPRHGDPTYPGAYYRIKVPALSALEWHPFSLAGSINSHHLTFFIASSGDWTRELYKIVSNPELRNRTAVQVQGPFYAPAHVAIKDATATTLLVASGIGITPFFSIMATKVTDEISYESDKDVFASLFREDLKDNRVKRSKGNKAPTSDVEDAMLGFSMDGDVQILRVVWTIREVTELMFYVDYVCELVKHQQTLETPAVFVDIYLTGLGRGSDLKYMLSRTLFLLTVAKRTSNYLKIHFGRPNLERIVHTILPTQVFYCGGKVLKESLAEICLQRNIHFHPEDFDSGAHFLQNTVDRLKKLVGYKPQTGSRK